MLDVWTLEAHLVRVQEKMKVQEDRDMAYLKWQSYKEKTLGQRAFENEAAKHFGPYKVIERVDKEAYKLQLPLPAKINPVFNLS